MITEILVMNEKILALDILSTQKPSKPKLSCSRLRNVNNKDYFTFYH